MSFISDIKRIREQARKKIEGGAVTEDYPLDRKKAIGILNEALATEMVCVLRYKYHYFMASGIHAPIVAREFKEHAGEEQEHADRIARRIRQLGGKPELNPEVIAGRSHTEYREGASIVEMLQEDLIAERIAIDTYREIVDFFGDKDPTSRRLMEEILAVEEEHAEELADLLFVVEPEGTSARRLYSKDEIRPSAARKTAAS